jgi:hypothetical protein
MAILSPHCNGCCLTRTNLNNNLFNNDNNMNVEYYEKKYLNEMIDSLTDQADFINDQDDLERYVNEYLYNVGMYNHEAREIVGNLKYDIFEVDSNYGERANSWQEAAQYAIHNLWLQCDFDYRDLKNYQTQSKHEEL